MLGCLLPHECALSPIAEPRFDPCSHLRCLALSLLALLLFCCSLPLVCLLLQDGLSLLLTRLVSETDCTVAQEGA